MSQPKAALYGKKNSQAEEFVPYVAPSVHKNSFMDFLKRYRVAVKKDDNGEHMTTHSTIGYNLNFPNLGIPIAKMEEFYSAYAKAVLDGEPFIIDEKLESYDAEDGKSIGIFNLFCDWDLTSLQPLTDTKFMAYAECYATTVGMFFPKLCKSEFVTDLNPENYPLDRFTKFSEHLLWMGTTHPDKLVSNRLSFVVAFTQNSLTKKEINGEEININKRGMHIYVPRLSVTKAQALIINDVAIKLLIQTFGERSAANGEQPWSVVLDTAVYTNGMRMMHSNKTVTCYECLGTGTNTNTKVNTRTCQYHGDTWYEPMAVLNYQGHWKVGDQPYMSWLLQEPEMYLRACVIRTNLREADPFFELPVELQEIYPDLLQKYFDFRENKVATKPDNMCKIIRAKETNNYKGIPTPGLDQCVKGAEIDSQSETWKITEAYIRSIWSYWANLKIKTFKRTLSGFGYNIWLHDGIHNRYCKNKAKTGIPNHGSNTIWFTISAKSITQRCNSKKGGCEDLKLRVGDTPLSLARILFYDLPSYGRHTKIKNGVKTMPSMETSLSNELIPDVLFNYYPGENKINFEYTKAEDQYYDDPNQVFSTTELKKKLVGDPQVRYMWQLMINTWESFDDDDAGSRQQSSKTLQEATTTGAFKEYMSADILVGSKSKKKNAPGTRKPPSRKKQLPRPDDNALIDILELDSPQPTRSKKTRLETPSLVTEEERMIINTAVTEKEKEEDEMCVDVV